jgi:glycine hydroxymethyltransferase
MDALEMREIADIVVNILKGTRADRIQEGSQKGQVSRGKFILDQRIEMEARARVTDLLSKYKLYPEIDLSIAESTVIGESHTSTGEVTVHRKLAVS